MTLYRGRFLFDIPEPPIGRWENQLGYRGMMEVWLIPGTETRLVIDWIDDDYSDDPDDPEGDSAWEVRLESGDDVEFLTSGTVSECETFAHDYMQQNPGGPPR